VQTSKRVNLYCPEKKAFVEDIYSRGVGYVEDRKWAMDFTWYSWIWYKLVLKLKYKVDVRKSVVIYIG
jgi:hypothetical protein